MSCPLPTVVKSMCKYGCIYREPAFKHLACRSAILVKKEFCVAPCYRPCPCDPAATVKNEIKEHTKKWSNKKNANQEMHLL